MSLFQLQRALQEHTLPQVLTELRANGLCLSHIIDYQTGDTLLHWLCQHAPLELLYQEMPLYRPFFRLVNDNQLTCFGQALAQKRQAFIHCLLHFDSENIFYHEQMLYFQHHKNPYFQSPGLDISALDYQTIFDFKKAFLNTPSVVQRCELIKNIGQQLVFTTPIDEHDNTLIHFIAEHGELVEVQHLLKLLIPGQIDYPNHQGQTALIQATKAGKQCLVSLLMHYGADETHHDKQRHCAMYYNQQIRKPVVFKPYNIVNVLPPLERQLKNFQQPNDIEKLFAYLDKTKLTLTTPVTRSDNTILHYLVNSCPLAFFPHLLAHVSKEMLAVMNIRGETPLHSLIKRKSYVKANALIYHGANVMQRDFSGLTAIEYAQPGVNLTARSAADYVWAKKLIKGMVLNLNWRGVVKALLDKGFRLDEPLDDNNDSALHYLFNRVPYKQCQWLLKAYPDCDFNYPNREGCTLLIKSLRTKRFLVTAALHETLLQKDPTLTLPNIPEMTEYADYLARPVFPTLLDYFMFSFSQPEIKQLAPDARIMHCYSLFLRYIRSNRLQYHGEKRDGAFLLDCEFNQKYTVNCYDLSAAFGYLLQSIGIQNISIHQYHNIKSRPFSHKGNIQGDFVCFDQAYHQQYYDRSDHFSFDAHYVLKVGNRFFDPTFCCYYDHENDVLALPPPEKENFHTTSITIDYNVMRSCVLKSPFNLVFMAALNKYLSTQQFTYFQQGETLLIKGQNQFVQLNHRNQSLTAFTQNISPNLLTLILKAWKQSMPIAEFKVNVITPNPQERAFIMSQFQNVANNSVGLRLKAS